MTQRGRPKAPAEGSAAALMAMRAAQRMIAVKDARNSLLPFTRLMMPHPDDADDAMISRYDVQHFHRLIAEAMEQVEQGKILRLIVALPPRHGKTEIISKKFPAWFLGRNPYKYVICTGYNDQIAGDSGRDVRATMKMPVFQQVFPGCTLRKGSASVERLQTTEGGEAFFVGAGSTITGRGGDVIIIDDPLKGAEEADSPTMREKMWTWFTQDVMSRLMTSMGAVIIVMTRWHEDDIVGRLTDPKNPCYNEEEAASWKILHLPALAERNDPLRRNVGEALWPERQSLDRLHAMRRLNARGFNANYQGRPSPEDGEFFHRKNLIGYNRPQDLPTNLRMYGASDHAVGLKQEHDRNCLMMAGVDEHDHIWVLPDLFWKRCETDVTVEAMIDMMEQHHPLTWWAESAHIEKSIGPFLRKRMMERKVFCSLEMTSPAKDKQTKAQAIRGRISMQMVHFPTFAPWWADALDEMLKFPRGRHDDFIDPLGHIGRGLGRLVKAAKIPALAQTAPPSGTFAWIKWAAKHEKREKELADRGGF